MQNLLSHNVLGVHGSKTEHRVQIVFCRKTVERGCENVALIMLDNQMVTDQNLSGNTSKDRFGFNLVLNVN